jgi:DUF1365 family protein
MTAPSALYVGHVMHHRLRPRVHRLRYRLFSVLLDLDQIDALSSRLRLFSRGRFNLFGFYDCDHGDGSDRPLREQAEALLARGGIDHGGPIQILTIPRLLGFAFNPLIVWFCHDRTGALCAIIYEVHNTFGERHSYVLSVEADRDEVQQDVAKRFHVSPFLPMAMDYAFRVNPPGDTLSIAITARDADGPVLFAVQRARRRALTDTALLRVAITHPLLTLKVVAGIGWEAARLWVKRVPVHDHVAQDNPVTFAHSSAANSSMEAPCN